jgi:GNAT superfamily N-acetyltransferase
MKEYDIFVTYNTTSDLAAESDPEHYLFEINFKIIGLSEDDEITLGEGHATQVRINQARDDRASLYEIFDVDQELTDTARAIFDVGFDDYHANVLKGFEDNFFPEDILIVRRMTLSPEYRGQKIGLSILHRIITDLGHGCGLVVIKPYPLSGPVRVGCEKLRKYWARLGFERVGKSNYWGLSMHVVLDSASELGLPSSLLIDKSKTKQ